jgi:hypothetical protein
MRRDSCFSIAASLLCGFLTACQSPDSKVEAAKQKAGSDIAATEAYVGKVREDAAKQISSAQGDAAVEEAKIKATENIAEAKRKVEDAKVDATESIVNAEQKAKVDPRPQLP